MPKNICDCISQLSVLLLLGKFLYFLWNPVFLKGKVELFSFNIFYGFWQSRVTGFRKKPSDDTGKDGQRAEYHLWDIF